MISKIRLQVATELLATDLPITQIGLRCGYTDHSAFVVSLSCIQACHLLCIGPLSKYLDKNGLYRTTQIIIKC